MIRYSCDLCKRDLNPDEELRYVVKIEVFAAFDPLVTDDDDDVVEAEIVEEDV